MANLAKGRVQMITCVDQAVYDAINVIAKDSGLSKMKVMEKLIESGLDDVRFLSLLGLTPRRMRALREGLESAGFMDPDTGDFQIPVVKGKHSKHARA